MNRRLASLCPLVAATFLAAAPAAAELPRLPVLTHEAAMKMVEACVAHAEEAGMAMAVAVVDAGDNLKAYMRMDGASMGPAKLAIDKASSSAKLGWSTKQIGEGAFNAETGAPTNIAFIDGMVLFAGGLPIKAEDGTLLGGIGASGAAPFQDEACAQAGLDAVEGELK